ncbi:GapA-binding peptide SR1P [Bacillus tuaregi]|nr:GapA-binding peptide SR1P [Bacillus tuaregi]
MGTIVCQVCDNTIEQFETEKVTTLYGQCTCCGENHKKNSK